MRPSPRVRSAIASLVAGVAVLVGCRGILGIDDVSLRTDDGVADSSTDAPDMIVDGGGAEASGEAGTDAAIDPFAGPVCSTDRFCWQNPLPQGNALSSVWAASAKEVWAVGDYGTVLRYDGTRWGGYARDPNESFSAITGDGKGRLWVAGTRSGSPLLLTSPTNPGEPTGYGWTELTFATNDGGAVAITPTSIWYDGADKLYVGGAGATTTSRLLSYGLTSKTWTAIAATDNVRAIWGRGPGDVWAVGDNDLIQRFTTATGWLPIASTVGSTANWRGVAGTPSLTYVVGRIPFGVGVGSYVVEIGAAGAQQASVTVPDLSTQLDGVAVSADGTQAWAVGELANSPSVLLERDAVSGAWRTVTSTGDIGDGLVAVAHADGDGWAVGAAGAIAHRTTSWSSAFQRVKLGADDWGHHIAPASASEVWVAADTQLVRFGADGGTTEDAGASPTITDLQEVGTDLWVTTRSGLRTRSAAGAWTNASGPTTSDQAAIFALSPTEAVIVGAFQDATRLRTGTWSTIPNGQLFFLGVWASGINDYWSVGYTCCSEGPHAYHLGGPATWVDVTSRVVGTGARGRLSSVWGRSANEIYVGGLIEDSSNNLVGQIYTYGGVTWQPTVLPVAAGDTTHHTVRAIQGLAMTSDVWAGGLPRYLWHTKPGGWELQRSGTLETITAIHANAVDDVWIAGTRGVVLRRR